jgi:CDGSH-type Zn-finger protein/uncharacterized Fe-S cluster protein YjdI
LRGFGVSVKAAVTKNARETGMEEAKGEKVTVVFDGQRCIHSRHCVTTGANVFLANVDGAWIFPDRDVVDAVVTVAHMCPSGAIAYRRNDGGAEEAAPPVNTVAVRENGPYAFRAELVIDGRPAGFRATLCRCGASKNKPFCDGSHNEIGFTATGEPAAKPDKTLEVRGGPVKVTAQKNGSLQVEGNLEICSGTGRVVERTTKTWLCRCGASQTKPFCDGSHSRIGFQAP